MKTGTDKSCLRFWVGFEICVRLGGWTGRDLNPRPPDCESGVHTKLNYRPTCGGLCRVRAFFFCDVGSGLWWGLVR